MNYREVSVKKSGTTFDFHCFESRFIFDCLDQPCDHDVLNMTKARCSRHTFYTLAVIHEHIFDKKIF